jgi:hypothetical protein
VGPFSLSNPSSHELGDVSVSSLNDLIFLEDADDVAMSLLHDLTIESAFSFRPKNEYIITENGITTIPASVTLLITAEYLPLPAEDK